jgi:hypothetical protein
MKKLRLFQFISFFLMVINLVLVFLFWNARMHSCGRPPRKDITEVLNMTGRKQTIVRKLQETHFKTKDQLMNRSRVLHEQLFQSFNDSSQNSAVLIDKIMMNQREIEVMTYNYFKEISRFCNEEQLIKLTEVIHEALKRLSGPPPRNK